MNNCRVTIEVSGCSIMAEVGNNGALTEIWVREDIRAMAEV